MDAHRSVSAGLASVVGGLVLLAGAPGAWAASSPPKDIDQGASKPKLVRFVRPTEDTLVQKGTGPIRVIVHTRNGAQPTHVDVDGVDVTRLLRRGPRGDYGAILDVDRHLHYGINDAFVEAKGRDGTLATDHVRFIVAKRDNSLLKLTNFQTATNAAPLQVAVRETTETNVKATLRVADGVSVRAYINGRRVDRAFVQEGKRLIVRLGADDRLHFGRNHIQLLVHKTSPSKRQSSFDLVERTVTIGRNAPIASAGKDSTVTQDDSAQLDARATKLPPGWGKPSFRWTITGAPKGSKARLRNASGSQPALVPDRPGRYQVRVSVGGKPAGAKASAAQAAGQAGISNDTTTVTAPPDIPPAGLRLDTRAESSGGQVELNGNVVPGGDCCDSINYAVLDRQTLELVTSGSVSADERGIPQLDTIIDGYTGSMQYLVVLNWAFFGCCPEGGGLDRERDALDRLLQKIGAQKLTDAQRQRIITRTGDQSEEPTDPQPGSAVGVPGAPAGSAFVSTYGGMSGSLRLNGAIGKYDFVFTDPVAFDTETNQTQTDFSPAKLTIKLGDKAFTQPNPGGGVSGFHLVSLNPHTLDGSDAVYTTNTADGGENADEVQRLANDLDGPVNAGNLVILQAFGAPHGDDGAWDAVAKEIERLGGTRQVFNALNAVAPRPLNGEDPNRKGPYAFVGRLNATAPIAEQSYPLNGLPGRLRGVLMRARDGGYEPMVAAPAQSDGQTPVNTALLDVTNQAPQPFPAFKDAKGQPVDAAKAQAVQNFLGGPDVTGLCSATVTACDIRKGYYQSYNASWSSIQDDLTNAQGECALTHKGFKPDQCEGIRTQLRDEVSKVAKVKDYLGPAGLKQPLGAASVAGLADLGAISQEIRDAVAPPPTSNATSSALTGIGDLLLIAEATPPPALFVATALSGAFIAGGYFTRSDGSPNLIGPQVTTESSKLGVELADRYRQAGDNLDDTGRLIVGDYGKLTTVASKVDAQPGPGELDWRLGNVGQAQNALQLAGKRTIYERLVPLAYPVMYDLGQIGNARDWNCDGQVGFDKHLFNEQADSAQFVGRFPSTQWTPTIAVAQEHAVDNLHDARIPGVPASIADQLFKSPADGGVGLTKLEFYSPRNGFRFFPTEPSSAKDTNDTLQQYPYGPGPLEGYRIFCSDIPIPPDNSG